MFETSNIETPSLLKDFQYPKEQLTKETFNNNDNFAHNSLNESVWDSLKRDLVRIYDKMRVVAVFSSNEEKQKELRQWDLWGPFIVCLLLGMKTSGLVFTTIFIIMWIGSMIITMNSTLLGGTLSLMQCICLLGYCSFPVVLSAFLTRVVLSFLPGIGKLVIVLISFLWSTKASVSFIAQNIPEKKKLLAVYPVMLFYLYLNYFILV